LNRSVQNIIKVGAIYGTSVFTFQSSENHSMIHNHMSMNHAIRTLISFTLRKKKISIADSKSQKSETIKWVSENINDPARLRRKMDIAKKL